MKTATTLLLTAATVSGFSVQPLNARTATSLNGLFDGVKDAFSAPPTEIDSERETPIDRWMGWSVVSEGKQAAAAAEAPKGRFNMENRYYHPIVCDIDHSICFFYFRFY
jgi:hypothetical protein